MLKEIHVEDYPYNMLIAARRTKTLELPSSLTKDILAGITYALYTLEEAERNVLEQRFRFGTPLSDEQQQIEKKAFKKLSHPSRWDYICLGIVGCGKKKAEEAAKKAFAQGYRAGYTDGVNAVCINRELSETVSAIDLPIETMPIPPRVCNALRRSGCKTIRDVASQNIETIRKTRNLGKKGIQEILQVLRSYGLTQTEWELY